MSRVVAAWTISLSQSSRYSYLHSSPNNSKLPTTEQQNSRPKANPLPSDTKPMSPITQQKILSLNPWKRTNSYPISSYLPRNPCPFLPGSSAPTSFLGSTNLEHARTRLLKSTPFRCFSRILRNATLPDSQNICIPGARYYSVIT